MTKTKPKTNKPRKPSKETGLKRLLKLAAFLRTKVPESSFCYASFMREGTLPPLEALVAGGGCGTTACAIGWTPAVFPRLVAWKPFHRFGDAYAVRLRGSRRTYNLRVAPHLFSISRDDAHGLFIPNSSAPWSKRGSSPYGDDSRKVVAEHIEAYVAWVRAGRPNDPEA